MSTSNQIDTTVPESSTDLAVEAANSEPVDFEKEAETLDNLLLSAVACEAGIFKAKDGAKAALHAMIHGTYVFFKKYEEASDLENYIKKRLGENQASQKGNKYTRTVQAVFCPSDEHGVITEEKVKARWRTKVSKIAGVMELADHLGRSDIDQLLTEKQAGYGTGLDAAYNRWVQIKREQEGTAESEGILIPSALLDNAGCELPSKDSLADSTALVAIYYDPAGKLHVLGPVIDDGAERLLKQFIQRKSKETSVVSQFDEMLRLVAFGKTVKGTKLGIKVQVTEDSVKLFASNATTASCVAYLHLCRPSQLPHGTYWLDDKLVKKLGDMSVLKDHGADYVLKPYAVADGQKVSFDLSVRGRLAAEEKYTSKTGKTVEWEQMLTKVTERPTKACDTILAKFDMSSPKSVRFSDQGAWPLLAEIKVTGQTEKWVSKVLATSKGSKSSPEVAAAVNAGEEGNRMTCAISADRWELLDDHDRVVTTLKFESPIKDAPISEVYTFHSKDLPNAYRAIKAILPDCTVKIGVYAKMLRLVGEHEGSVAEITLPTFLRSGSRCAEFAEIVDLNGDIPKAAA